MRASLNRACLNRRFSLQRSHIVSGMLVLNTALSSVSLLSAIIIFSPRAKAAVCLCGDTRELIIKKKTTCITYSYTGCFFLRLINHRTMAGYLCDPAVRRIKL